MMPLPDKFAAQGWCLAFDTSSPTSALVLGRLEEAEPRYSDVRLDGANQASVDLHLRIEALLSSAGIGFDQLVAVGCGRGPGTFSGSRVALATGKGIALAMNLPLFGLSTLHALAAKMQSVKRGELILALLDARRGELYGQAFVAGARDEDSAGPADTLRELTTAVCADLTTLVQQAVAAAEHSPVAAARRAAQGSFVIQLVGPGSTVQQLASGFLGVELAVMLGEQDLQSGVLGVSSCGLWSAMRARVRRAPDDLTSLDVEYLRASYAELGLNAPKRTPSVSPFVDMVVDVDTESRS